MFFWTVSRRGITVYKGRLRCRSVLTIFSNCSYQPVLNSADAFLLVRNLTTISNAPSANLQTVQNSSSSLYVKQQKAPSSTATSEQSNNINESTTSKTSLTPFYGDPRPISSSTASSWVYPSPDEDGMYHDLSRFQKLAVATNSAFTALADPMRADAVAALGEVTGTMALRGMRNKMINDSIGQRILSDKPIVNQQSIHFDELQKCGTNTFGAAYYSFMEAHGFDPEGRDVVKYIEDDELSYVMLRHRQCHDYWHTLFNLPPNVYGELVLKWIELMQTNIPVAALSCTFGPLQLSSEKRQELMTVYLPWAIKTGKNAQYLLNVYYEEEFHTDIETLRKRIGIEPAPTSSLLKDMS